MSLKVVLISMAAILMMSAKLATVGLLKLNAYWSKYYDAIIFVQDVTNKILSRYSSHIVDVVMWQSLVTPAFL